MSKWVSLTACSTGLPICREDCLQSKSRRFVFRLPSFSPSRLLSSGSPFRLPHIQTASRLFEGARLPCAYGGCRRRQCRRFHLGVLRSKGSQRPARELGELPRRAFRLSQRRRDGRGGFRQGSQAPRFRARERVRSRCAHRDRNLHFLGARCNGPHGGRSRGLRRVARLRDRLPRVVACRAQRVQESAPRL